MQYHAFTHEYVQRLIHGDADTESHFVRYFSDLLLVKLQRSLRGNAAIDDLRQETFLRVFKVLRRNGLAAPEKIGAFVHGVCNNVLAEHYRETSRLVFADPVTEAPAHSPSPEAEMQMAERKQRVRQVLDQLPACDRNILHLLFIEERGKDEICRLCGVDRNYLRVLLHRAKNKFRETAKRLAAAGGVIN